MPSIPPEPRKYHHETRIHHHRALHVSGTERYSVFAADAMSKDSMGKDQMAMEKPGMGKDSSTKMPWAWTKEWAKAL
jgi:hypothetical protein